TLKDEWDSLGSALMSHRTMDWLMPLGCILLWVGLVLAEVGSFSGCYKYFYQDAEPCGFATANTTKICQRYSNLYHFATLYDRPQRIPRWSAYTLGDPNCPEQARKMSQWFVEPQVSPNKSPEMTTEAESTLSLDERRSSQAISKDYEDMSYDRGHLNPNAFQCNVGRTVTFTLTNTAPMNPYFNQVHWSKLEKTLKAQLTGSCRNVGGKPYLVTGAVPSDRDRNRPYNRVSVPSHVWTAVCCDHADNNRKFSFAFIGENKEASSLQIIPVEQLNTELLHLYKTPGPVEVFADDCGSKSQKGQEVLSAIKKALYSTFQNFITDSYSQLLPPAKSSKLDRETSQVMTSQTLDQKKVQLMGLGFQVGISRLADGHSQLEKAYEQDNLAPAVARLARALEAFDRVCPFKELNSGGTANGWSCVKDTCCDFQGYAYSWCYTSDKNHWDYCCTEECTVNPVSKVYECPRGDGSITKCSPHGYSMQTISGKACRSDHPCGLYGERYFWCYTDDEKKWDYCCSPQHQCGKHGYKYPWCYIQDPEKSWKYCIL
uniref:Kringle domain-containing protein n=1 Tax=Chelonoidis abingdonii TaxID=106734 RepID=A0A8C0HGJ2_CHEAB